LYSSTKIVPGGCTLNPGFNLQTAAQALNGVYGLRGVIHKIKKAEGKTTILC
jgi:hypothetical protein